MFNRPSGRRKERGPAGHMASLVSDRRDQMKRQLHEGVSRRGCPHVDPFHKTASRRDRHTVPVWGWDARKKDGKLVTLIAPPAPGATIGTQADPWLARSRRRAGGAEMQLQP
jgi:hypothetical protein